MITTECYATYFNGRLSTAVYPDKADKEKDPGDKDPDDDDDNEDEDPDNDELLLIKWRQGNVEMMNQ